MCTNKQDRGWTRRKEQLLIELGKNMVEWQWAWNIKDDLKKMEIPSRECDYYLVFVVLCKCVSLVSPTVLVAVITQ